VDSFAALVLGVALERHYGVAIPDENVDKQAFGSIDALAAFISAARAA
jgi:acyl carrier protein